jgi:hypothetical protein
MKPIIRLLTISLCLTVMGQVARGLSCVPTYEQNGGEYYSLDCGIATCTITKKLWWNIYWRDPQFNTVTASRIR